MYRIEPYNTIYYKQWNDFVARSKNGTFLFHRDFMEYHADRFTDHSLLVFDEQTVVALLPANRVGDTLHSHQGLTYGGLVLDNKAKLAGVIGMFKDILQHLATAGIAKLYLKTIPRIYHQLPSEELEYALFLANATLVRRDTMAVIETSYRLKVANNRMEGVKKGITNNFVVTESDDFKRFWEEVLIPNLHKRHDAKPVHLVEEIVKLKKLFPNDIKLFIILKDKHIAAGTVIFETATVAHAQYISAGEDKGETGSLDFLYHHIVTQIYSNKKYFDFGISNEQQGRKLNEGLAFWKESFGARTIAHDFYEVETANFTLLDSVLI